MSCHVSGEIPSGVAVRVEGGVAGEGRLVGKLKFTPGVSARSTCQYVFIALNS